jgi:hypothetical protein
MCNANGIVCKETRRLFCASEFIPVSGINLIMLTVSMKGPGALRPGFFISVLTDKMIVMKVLILLFSCCTALVENDMKKANASGKKDCNRSSG